MWPQPPPGGFPVPPVYCPVSAKIICGPRRPLAKQPARGILDFNDEVSKVSFVIIVVVVIFPVHVDVFVIVPYIQVSHPKVEAWICGKELLVSQGDLGKDYEHCMELQRMLEDTGREATRGVDKERIDHIFQASSNIVLELFCHCFVQMAASLCTEAGSEAPAVEAKLEEIRAKYTALQQDIQVTLFCKKKTHHISKPPF